MNFEGGKGRSRASFDIVAEDYDLYRPAPPAVVVGALLSATALERNDAVLEVGCGTGQLSVPLAKYGVALTALELGANLAALARRNLAPFHNAHVEVTAFEEWPLPEQQFDSVVSANAFHWIDPAIRVSKSAAALHPYGSLAIVHMHHVRGGTPGFFEDTQPYYIKWGLSDDPFFQPSAPDDIPTLYPELEAGREFTSVHRKHFEIPIEYSSSSYVGWLRTDSLVNSLDVEERDGFLRDIGELIDTQYDGAVARNFVYDLITARRLA
jgi:SAM-dependent methyltransferase